MTQWWFRTRKPVHGSKYDDGLNCKRNGIITYGNDINSCYLKIHKLWITAKRLPGTSPFWHFVLSFTRRKEPSSGLSPLRSPLDELSDDSRNKKDKQGIGTYCRINFRANQQICRCNRWGNFIDILCSGMSGITAGTEFQSRQIWRPCSNVTDIDPKVWFRLVAWTASWGKSWM